MTLYHYSAVTRAGARISGEMDAASRASVLEDLHRLGHLPIDVVERAQSRSGANGDAGRFFYAASPARRQVTLFTRELAMLLKAGLPLDRALKFLADDASSEQLQRVIRQIHSAIDDGKSLHDAMAAQAQTFPSVYVSMVRVAEASGTLEAVLERIALEREKSDRLRSKALSEALYPILLILMAIAAVVVMLVYVVPRFKGILGQNGVHLPAEARNVIALSDWLIANGSYLLAGLAALPFVGVIAWHQRFVRVEVEKLLMRLPLIGTILRLNLAIRFSRALALLLENGVELPAALKLVRATIANKAAEGMLDESYNALRKGKSFLDPIAESRLFPPALVNILRVGEETGGLAGPLTHMSDMLEEKLETSVRRSFAILEPAIILLVSGFVAAIIISIITAIISINDLAV